MHSAVQTAAASIISYHPLSDFNFAKYTTRFQLHALFTLQIISPWFNTLTYLK